MFSLNVNRGQTKEFVIKAALLEKFSNYIDWPSDNQNVFSIGITGDSEFGESLKDIYKNIKLKNKKVEISDFNFDTQSRPEVLIVGEMKNKELKKILNITRNQPVLIVTDVEKYLSEGPHIIFYFSDEGNIRFKFNKKTFGRTGLYVSHLLLRYAEFVE